MKEPIDMSGTHREAWGTVNREFDRAWAEIDLAKARLHQEKLRVDALLYEAHRARSMSAMAFSLAAFALLVAVIAAIQVAPSFGVCQ
ncbi:hypothetical protein [Pandoraea sputorum]|uniref:hypothetical protein n=1 Tax=Pandoraea sputorum TaxID=93222 RepID=UPI0012425747|nr:hypothetical protein [Pandoraea sputorum]